MADSPTSLTLKFLRAAGHTAAVVEHRNQYAGPPAMKCKACGKNRVGLTVDLFGVIDLVALHPAIPGVLGVQTTSRANGASRRKKLLASEDARLWVQAGNRLWLVTWAKAGRKWEPKIEEITIGLFTVEDA